MLIVSLILAVVVLSLKTGLLMGSSWLTMRRIGAAAFIFGGSVVLLSIAFNTRYLLISQLIDRYTFSFACVIGFLFIYLGLQQPRRLGCVSGTDRLKYWVSFLPCPLCVGAMTISVIYTAGCLRWNLFTAALATGTAFALAIVFIAWLLRMFLTGLGIDVTGIFHQALLFLGLFTLISAFLIPNVVAVMNEDHLPITFDSPRNLAFTALGFVLLLLLGVFKQRRESSKIYQKRG